MDSRIKGLREDLLAIAIPSDAITMKAYMKDHFAYFGVKAPARKACAQPHIKQWLNEKKEVDSMLVNELWVQPEREFQYIAMEYLARTKRHWSPSHLGLFENLIIAKSWWDTVDFIAASLVGPLIGKFPELKVEMEDWNQSEDMWKVRTSMLYQLKYKDKVDFEQLSRFILSDAESKEFFLQKAAGWALRQYSKFNAPAVASFIRTHTLAPLTVREGSKYVKL